LTKKKLLVTGGAGFIGSNFIWQTLETRSDYEIWNLDKLTYAGNLENLSGIEEKYPDRYHFVKGDIADENFIHSFFEKERFDEIVNFAAESHVDRSIHSATPFIITNVLGTQILLDAARKFSVKKFLQVGTDEVYGSLGDTGYFTEETPLQPNSPYSSSKTAADLLVRAAFHTHGMPVLTTRCSNNYGPYQFPEKLIPLMISNALADKALPVYGDGMNIRDWLHVKDHCDAILTVLEKGQFGEVYNIGGNNEWANINIVKKILELLGKSESLITYVKDRPGHDRRYAIDASKIKNELGWEPSYTFETGIQETITWYVEHPEWWQRIKSGEYLNYYKQHYEMEL
jgi:dTDP-glucose 4,6-dehydratase